jgi:aspartate/methionine/tyrosine aminotransferase
MIVKPADRLASVGEYYFSKKLEVIRRMRASGHDVINLGIGSPDLAPAEKAIEAAATALRSEKNHGYAAYRSSPELRRAMAGFYDRVYGVRLDPETEVLPLLGSKEGILYTSMAYLNPGDAVLLPNPGYPAYSSVAQLIGARLIHYDLTEESGWLPDLAAIERQDLSRCKLMWVNYPHMPTGRAGNAQLFESLVAFGRRHGILVCNDNPYGLVLNRQPPMSILSFDPARDAAIELNSLSKSFNMAGWRVGMLLGARDAVDSVLQVKSNVDSGMFTAVQAGAAEALASPASWHERRNEIYRERRQAVWRIFDRLGFKYDPEQVGLFVWAKAPESVTDVEAFVDELLERKHVFLTPGFIFGSNGRRYARASLCAPQGVLEEALRRIGGGA